MKTIIKQKILDALSEAPHKTMIVGYKAPVKYTALELAILANTDVQTVYRVLHTLKKQGHDIRTVKHTREVYEKTGNVEYFIEPETNKAGVYHYEIQK